MRKLFAFAIFFALCSCQTKQVQNPPAKIDTERQAKIEKALKDLKDKNAIVRANAVLYLEELGAEECVKDIAGLLKDEDAPVRCQAVFALGRFGAKEYVKDIAEFLKDKDAYVRGSAAVALGALGAKEYANDIKELLNDKYPSYVSAEAERVLKEWNQLPADSERRTEKDKETEKLKEKK